MNSIRILPPAIVSKIAAGEVVERPASVLKELVENSLDAGASSIEVLLQGAGKQLIELRDDGTGIAQDDLDFLFHRHATSKLGSADDLYSIASLGFRGEALYSIGAVSDVSLRSKTASQAHGWEIHSRAHRLLSKKPASMPTGTVISVKELFFNTPARRKFLKSDTQELHRMLDVFLPYTLLYPHIRFMMRHGERNMLELPPVKKVLKRIADALHVDTAHLIEGNRAHKERDIALHLVLGDINIQRARKDMQYLFVNGRPVESSTVSFHMNDVYRLLFPRGTYPFFSVHVKLPPEEVDVNVHPAKRQVKLKNETAVTAFLRATVEQLLMTCGKAKKAAVQPRKEKNSPPASFPIPEQEAFSWEENATFSEQTNAEAAGDTLREKLNTSRFLGSFLKRYCLFETQDSLLLVDQHAAGERITFERLRAQMEKGGIEIQQLLSPLLLSCSPQEILLWEEHKEDLESMGFSVSLYDRRTLALHAHPQLIRNPEASLKGILAGEHFRKMDRMTLIRLACRSSVMSGTQLQKEEAEYQKQQLLSCEDPFTCPHGRPTLVEISAHALNTQFLRT